MDDLAPAIAVPLIFLFNALLVGWAIWLYARRKQERIRSELDIRRRMLDKFATGDELAAFLASDTGRQFVESLSTDQNAHARKILGSIKVGAVLTFLGAGLWMLVALDPDRVIPVGLFGTIALATGLGFLASAALSFRLSRDWGLLPPRVS